MPEAILYSVVGYQLSVVGLLPARSIVRMPEAILYSVVGYQMSVVSYQLSVVGLLPARSGIRNEFMNVQLHIMKSKELPIVTNWRFIWLKKKKLSSLANAYLKYISSHKYEIVSKKFDWYLSFE